MTLQTLRYGGSIAMLAFVTAIASSARADLTPEELAKLSQKSDRQHHQRAISGAGAIDVSEVTWSHLLQGALQLQGDDNE